MIDLLDFFRCVSGGVWKTVTLNLKLTFFCFVFCFFCDLKIKK